MPMSGEQRKEAKPQDFTAKPLKDVSEYRLLADTQLFLRDDSAVAVDVFTHQVVEKTTTLTYQHLKSAFSCMIFVI